MATEGTGSGPSRELGRTWKVSRSINIASKATATLADIDGPGAMPRGFETGPRYLPLQDDIASTVYWYQAGPHGKYPTPPDVNHLDVN